MIRTVVVLLFGPCFAAGCDNGDSAVARGVGAACADSSQCSEPGQVCLTEFRGGMCGIADCTRSNYGP